MHLTLRSPATAPLPGTLAVFTLLALIATRVTLPMADSAPAASSLDPMAASAAAAPRNAAGAERRLADAVRARRMRASGETRASADAVLRANAHRVDALATAEPGVAARLAAEFGTPASRLRDERQRFGLSWGELAIAHTLAANARPALPVAALAHARSAGTDWSTLAAALELDLGDCVTAVREEANVAAGIDPADGHVAPIRAGAWTPVASE